MISPLKIALFVCLLTAGTVLGQSGNWESAGKMPLGISGAAVVVVDSSIYVLGGYSDSLQSDVDWILRFNPRSNKWNLAGHLKVARDNFIADKIGNKIYSVCGETNYPYRPTGALEVFDCNTGNSSILDTNHLFIRNSPAGLIKDSVLYIIGGSSFQNHGGSPYILEYNIPAKIISYTFQGPPGMREEQMSALIDNSIYLFGGLANGVTRDIFNYKTQLHSLAPIFPGLIKPRSGGMAIRIPNKNQVIIMGGYDEYSLALSTVEMYEIMDSSHIMGHTLSSMHFRRTDFMTAYFDSCIYIFGGEDDFQTPVYSIERLSFITGIENTGEATPSGFKIAQNYPNPFNPTTTISYSVGEKSAISIKIYNLLGKEVALLVDEEKAPGYYTVQFNGQNLPSGVYFYRITAVTDKGNKSQDYVETRKMMLLK